MFRDACNGVKINIKNNAQKIGQTSGTFQSFVLKRYEFDITLSILWDSVARTILSNAKSGTLAVLVLTWGTLGNPGYLNINLPYCIPIDAGNIERNENGNFVNITFKAIDNGGSGPTITMVNSTDRSW